MEVIKGTVSSIAPPEPEGDNPMTTGEALNVVNTVMITQYRAFDKLKAVLAVAQQVEDERAAQQAALDDLKAQISQANFELDQAKKDVVSANAARKRALAAIETAQKEFDVSKAKAQIDFEAHLAQQQADFDADMKEQARVAQVNLEENIAGLKREMEGARKEAEVAKQGLATLIENLDAKAKELAETQTKLDTANAALADIKSRL